jgi:hypothetical protein
MKKSDQGRDEGLLSPLNSKWHWHNCVKTHPHVFVNNQIPQLLKEELISGMSITIAFFFDLICIGGDKSLKCARSKK